jgi:UTP--glucose-1-phosphate uridylyltransferase
MVAPVTCAVIPVGGLGTRFLPATKAVPKEMLPVVDKPLIQYAVEEAIAAGIERIVIVTGRGKSAIEDHFDHAVELEQALAKNNKTDSLALVEGGGMPPGAIAYTRQQKPLGLGHAVWCARDLVGDQPFAVMLPDDMVLAETPCLSQMLDAYRTVGGNLAAVMDVPREHTARYGVLDVGIDDGQLVEVRGLVEKPAPEAAPSTLSIIGRSVLQPEIFAKLEAQQAGAGGEIQLTDAMAGLIGNQPFHGFRFDGTRYDCGDKLGFIEATLAYALARDDLAAATRYMLRRFISSI